MDKNDLIMLLVIVGIVIIAWAISLLFHIPFVIIALIGCVVCAIITATNS